MRIFTNLGLWGWSWAQQFRVLPVLAEHYSLVLSLHPAVHNYLDLHSASSPTWKPNNSHQSLQTKHRCLCFSPFSETSRLPKLILLYNASWVSSSLRQSPVNLLCGLACPTMPAMTSSFEVLINTSTTKLVNAVTINELHGRPQLQADGGLGSPSPNEVSHVHIFPISALPRAPFSFCLGFRNLGRC